MNVDLRIQSAANIFFGLAIVSFTFMPLFPFSTLWGFLVPTAVFAVTVIHAFGHGLVQTFLWIIIVAGLAAFGVAGRRRWLTVYALGVILYGIDGGAVILVALVGIHGAYILAGAGLEAIAALLVHLIVLGIMVSGFLAMLADRENQVLARDLDVQAELARRLAASTEPVPPPPAADFTKRFREVQPPPP